MENFVSAKKLVRIKEIIELWEVELQRVNCIIMHYITGTSNVFTPILRITSNNKNSSQY